MIKIVFSYLWSLIPHTDGWMPLPKTGEIKIPFIYGLEKSNYSYVYMDVNKHNLSNGMLCFIL